MARAEAYLRTKWHLDPSSRLATTDMGRKLGGAVPIEVELGPHLTQCCPGRGLRSYQVASSSIQPFGHNRHGPKICGGLCPFLGGAGSSSGTLWPGLRPTSTPSGILIHPAVWPQKTWAENWGGCAPFSGEGTWVPPNTMWPGPRPTCTPSFILIH